MSETVLSPDDQKTIRSFRWRLLALGTISAAIDAALFTAEIGWMIASLGSSLIIDELVEWVISSLIARNKMRLKKRYKIAGFIPLPGVTSLSLQAAVELARSFRKPEEVLERLAPPASE